MNYREESAGTWNWVKIGNMNTASPIAEDATPLSPITRFRAAMVLAMAADALQIFVFPLFAQGAFSPADDLLDIAVAAVLVHLLGWHWDFCLRSLLN